MTQSSTTDLPHTADVLLAQSLRQGLDRLEAAQLMLHALGRATHDRAWLLAHGGEVLSTEQADLFNRFAVRRLSGEPVAYITGTQGFYGLNVAVGPGVLVPRPDTETLVDWALQCMDATAKSAVQVADWGTGSGAIALALQAQRPQAKVWAMERSPVALAQAQANAQRLGLHQLRVVPGDWHTESGLQALEPARHPHGGLDVIVSNPPYIEADDSHMPGLRHEPAEALVSGADGLHDIRCIIACAPYWLAPSGWLLLEHGWNQGPAVQALFEQYGWRQVEKRLDLPGHWRCTGAMRPESDTQP